MTPKTAIGLAGLATLVVLVLPGSATARPAAGHKPTGTIFFLRETGNGEHAFAMTAAGKAAHRVPHIPLDMSVYPASKAHLLAFTFNKGEFTKEIGISTYKGRLTHTASPTGLYNLISISPNGKYLGVEVFTHRGRFAYEITTITGKPVATLFSFATPNPHVEESWRANSKELVVLNATAKARTTSTLKIYKVHGKVVRTLSKNAGASFSVAWSAAGDVAYSTNDDINVVRQTGGKPHALVHSGVPLDGGLTYSPNGAYLAYGRDTGHDNGQLWRVKADGTGTVKINQKGTAPAWG